MNTIKKELSAETMITVRFSEADIMGVAWHGSYLLYLEDAREAFGRKYGLSYTKYIDENTAVPIVELKVDYRHPLRYGMNALVRIKYCPTESAKIVFKYEIFTPEDNTVYLTAMTVQVFMDKNYNLLWESPEFYEEWKRSMDLI